MTINCSLTSILQEFNIEGSSEESMDELSLNFSGNSPLQAGNSPVATVIEKTTEVAEKVVETTKKVAKTVDKVISNKTVGDVVSGGGLASSMIDASAYLARKDVVKAQKKTVRAAQKLKINIAGKLKDKGSKTLKKISKAFSFVGKVLGITSAINNFSNVKKNGIKVTEEKLFGHLLRELLILGYLW